MDHNDILFHLGEARDQYQEAISPPIAQSSNFAFRSVDTFRQAVAHKMDYHIYTRGNNPTVQILRKKMAALCGTEDALAFASGSGAVAAAVLSVVRSGDHIISVQKPYAFTKVLIDQFLGRFGVTCTYVDMRDPAQIEAAMQPNTRLLFLESPNSLTFELQDLTACVQIARDHGILTAIDNSCATPFYQRAADFGIDLVVHSATKYLSGHSDAMGGIVCGSRSLLQPIFDQEFMALGGIMSPRDAALVIRGLRTLHMRISRSNTSAQWLTQKLSAHPRVRQVLYPLHPDFPQYDLARRQMTGAGGLFSILLDTQKIEAVDRFAESLHRFAMAVSWGGHESLVLPISGFHQVPGQADSPLPFQLVRLYIGLEDPEWLWADLEKGLDQLT